MFIVGTYQLYQTCVILPEAVAVFVMMLWMRVRTRQHTSSFLETTLIQSTLLSNTDDDFQQPRTASPPMPAVTATGFISEPMFSL